MRTKEKKTSILFFFAAVVATCITNGAVSLPHLLLGGDVVTRQKNGHSLINNYEK